MQLPLSFLIENSNFHCPENPRAGVAQSRTRLNWLSSSSVIFVAKEHHAYVKKKKDLAVCQVLPSPWHCCRVFTAFLALLKLRQEREIKGRWVCAEAMHESSLVSDPGVPYCLLVWISIIVSVQAEDNPSTCPRFSSSISPLLPLLTSKDTEVNQLPRGFMTLGEVWNWSIHCRVSWHSEGQEMRGESQVKIIRGLPWGSSS